VTDDAADAGKEALGTVSELTRVAGHEIRNALNGVAVNVEVVRSRLAKESAGNDLMPFADRASAQVGVANALTEGLLSLVGCVLSAQAEGTLRPVPGGVGRRQIELMIYGSRAEAAVSDIKRFGELTGVGVERRGERVILSLSSEGKSHSKE
jgi:hypothetical protein